MPSAAWWLLCALQGLQTALAAARAEAEAAHAATATAHATTAATEQKLAEVRRGCLVGPGGQQGPFWSPRKARLQRGG